MSKKRKKNIGDKILKFAKKNAKHESASEAAKKEEYEEEMEFDNSMARKSIYSVYASALENPGDIASYFGDPEKDAAKFLRLIMEQKYAKVKVERIRLTEVAFDKKTGKLTVKLNVVYPFNDDSYLDGYDYIEANMITKKNTNYVDVLVCERAKNTLFKGEFPVRKDS
jgi:hypothetical protein